MKLKKSQEKTLTFIVMTFTLPLKKVTTPNMN
jgi:hypothetical protein